jgi:hypothetical protein
MYMIVLTTKWNSFYNYCSSFSYYKDTALPMFTVNWHPYPYLNWQTTCGNQNQFNNVVEYGSLHKMQWEFWRINTLWRWVAAESCPVYSL